MSSELDPQSENIVWQWPGQSVSSCLSLGQADRAPRRFHHALNLYRAGDDGSLGDVQRLTVDSMRRARSYVPESTDLQVDFVAVFEEPDTELIPTDFARAPVIDRTVRDLPGFGDGPAFPLVFDILDKAGQAVADSSEWVIFTNSDICLQPGFYVAARDMLAAGFDSLIINRRTIDAGAMARSLELAAAELGEVHPGLDCFIFPASWLAQFERNDACVGVPLVMRSLFHNLVARAERLLILTEAGLTFHYGDDRPWLSEDLAEHRGHNSEETRRQIERLRRNPTARERIDRLYEIQPRYIPRPAPVPDMSAVVAPGFSSDRYQTINRARLDHLSTLPIALDGRSVLELGAGPGDLTGFFVDRGCDVTSIDARPENIRELTSRYPGVDGRVLDLDGPIDPLDRQFDVAFIYGLLYHMGDPAALLRWAAAHCSDYALVSTCVSPGAGVELNPVAENAATGTQSASGRASRPTRGWVLEELGRNFTYAGICRRQPHHFEFPTDWEDAPTEESKAENGLSRAVFYASHSSIDEEIFSPELLRFHGDVSG